MSRILTRLALAAFLAVQPTAVPPSSWQPGIAAAQAQSSGGYSRPSSGAARPSYGGGSTYSSGGYSAPSRRPSTSYAAPGGAYSGGDTAVSRRAGGESLQQYRASQAPPPPPPPSGGYGTDQRRPSTGGGGYGYGYGGGGYVPNRGMDLVTPLLLWGLLNNLSAPDRARDFYDAQGTPAYAQWRAQAEQAAQNDPAVARKLAELDSQMAQYQGQPRQPPHEEGDAGVFLILLAGAGILVLLWLARRRMARPGNPAAAALSGSARTRFRVGQTFPYDPSPFLLAAGLTKVQPPPDGANISIEAVGLIDDGGVLLHRLYLPGGNAFFQLHLGADGRPDECRYFSLLDVVTPASNEEWGAWLDPEHGMIGWPEFQTRDGKIYGRVWASGGNRIAPRAVTETRQDLHGTTTRHLQTMLYGLATNAAPPASQVEYALVAAVDAGTEAWVELHAGIDINPATLTLPTVPL